MTFTIAKFRALILACLVNGVAFSFASLGNVATATTVADWTFETSAHTTAGPVSPEVGAGSASGSHAGAAVYSSPAGNGSAHSYSSTAWALGDYYQFQVNTAGLKDVVVTWDQTSSNTGPRDFQLEYSTNGSSFTNFGSVFSVLANSSPNPPWNGTTSSSLYTLSQDLSSITALNDSSTVYFRIAMATTTSANGGTVASGGTDRVDNVIVSANPVPEPSSLILAGLGAAVAACTAIRRRYLAA